MARWARPQRRAHLCHPTHARNWITISGTTGLSNWLISLPLFYLIQVVDPVAKHKGTTATI